MVSVSLTIAGIPLWAIGGTRKAKAEIALKNFDFKTNKSMAVGIGIMRTIIVFVTDTFS